MTVNNFDKLNNQLPDQGKIMALDVGSKRIGLASSDQLRMIASPNLIIKRQGGDTDLIKIKEFIIENSITAVIIGMPYQMDGSESEISQFVESFSQNLNNFLNKQIPIILFDERLSSFEARRIKSQTLSRKKNQHYDDIAASVILQHFLDELKS